MSESKLVKPQNTDRVLKEFEEADDLLKDLGKTVTVFGSARTKNDSVYYTKALEFGEKIGKAGFNVITGGGPGIMKAVNEGASKVPGVKSVGLGIQLYFEPKMNKFANLSYNFSYFFIRKVMMVKYADAFLVFPGGIGTGEEMLEVMTLIQTSKTHDAKIYLVGVDFWSGFFDWMKSSVLEEGYISQEDLDSLIVTNDIDFVVQDISKIKG